MFTTSYYLVNAEFYRLEKFLEKAKKAESLRDIDIVWFEKFDDVFMKRTNSVVYSRVEDNIKMRLMIDVVKNIIEYNSLLFTLQDYVDTYELSLNDFSDEEKKDYRTVGELLVEDYKMPTNKIVHEWIGLNKDNVGFAKSIIEPSRQELIMLINKKKQAKLVYIDVGNNGVTRCVDNIYTWFRLINHIGLIQVRSTFGEVVKVGYADGMSDNVIVIN
jgi:hypothetical protein